MIKLTVPKIIVIKEHEKPIKAIIINECIYTQNVLKIKTNILFYILSLDIFPYKHI